jgi:hypothetical protein
MGRVYFSIVFIAFFAIAGAASKTRLGNCALLTLFLLLGTGMIWNARANQYVLKEGQRTTARVVYSTICTTPFMGRIIHYRYPGADRRNPLHLFNLFSMIGSQQSDVGIAVEIAGLGGTVWKRPRTVTVAYLPNNPRAHVVVEYCSTEVFWGGALLCLAASVCVVLNLLCLIRDERSARPPLQFEADLPPNRIQPLSASPPTLPQVTYDTATRTQGFQTASP